MSKEMARRSAEAIQKKHEEMFRIAREAGGAPRGAVHKDAGVPFSTQIIGRVRHENDTCPLCSKLVPRDSEHDCVQ